MIPAKPFLNNLTRNPPNKDPAAQKICTCFIYAPYLYVKTVTFILHFPEQKCIIPASNIITKNHGRSLKCLFYFAQSWEIRR
jgi:hypothetical protein